ncbi:MAG TPA: hypothetical protein VFH78_02295 [Candidatus Thermoplasmatota archaeon]|nr:hypothetical protein [Candidatus Thermoplasmatota archaeon]
MDEATADRLVQKLIERGLVEERGDEVGPTRRWNARVQAAAERLNLEVARTGVQPEGNPLVLAVAQALRDEGYADGDTDDAIRVLVTLELSRMPPDKRARYGFA